MVQVPLERHPVELLADDFARRCRLGESPSASEYIAQHPEHAAEIERLFPAVALMERLRGAAWANREACRQRPGQADPPQDLGDFRLIREIGRGGMGIVYQAEQLSLRRHVAVKILPEYVLLRRNRLKRFQCEARTAARLHHTNIVPVFGIGEQGGLHYYVMPLVRGVGLDEVLRELKAAQSAEGFRRSGDAAPDLGRVVQTLIAEKFGTASTTSGDMRRGAGDPETALAGNASSATGVAVRDIQTAGSQPCGAGPRDQIPDGGRLGYWRTVAHIGRQAAEALQYAHSQGTLHRDIKPGNLLVDGNGEVFVADFGLARAVDGAHVSRTGEVVGTLRYMAPEQLRGAVEQRSDLYSLGLTLYELLTLRSAFEDPDRTESGGAGRPEPVRPHKFNPAVPRDLETIVLKCLAFEPSQRYPTAEALAGDLRSFLADKPIQARRASWFERAWRWRRRNPALAMMSGLAAALVVCILATASAGYVENRRACAAAQKSLVRAEATSQLALDVLDNIYLRLSPDHLLIVSDSDPGGGVCTCVGLRSSTSALPAGERPATLVQASEETASLLQNLLVFYDRLAEQVSDDSRVTLQSAIASRRVGDIRQRLGQLDRAEAEYRRAVQKLAACSLSKATPEARAELAHCHNEIGNVQSARLDAAAAYASHGRAWQALRPPAPISDRPEAFRYELARTMYFLATKRSGTSDLGPPTPARKDCRRAAIKLLEQLLLEQPGVPDYQFLLALCHRPSVIGPAPEGDSTAAHGRQRAIEILENLTARYPDVADYRYELTTTYAWTPVRLFPWQRRTAAPSEAELNLTKALAESQRLVAHHPENPHYARCEALILAKWAAICWETGRLGQAETLFQQALQRQNAVVATAAHLPAHHRVLAEFLRLRVAQVRYERAAGGQAARRESRELLQTCVTNLKDLLLQPELAKDQLARSTLSIATHMLNDVADPSGSTNLHVCHGLESDPRATEQDPPRFQAVLIGR